VTAYKFTIRYGIKVGKWAQNSREFHAHEETTHEERDEDTDERN